MLNERLVEKVFVVVLVTISIQINLLAQKPTPPIPIELLAGHESLYFQMVVKKPFTQTSKFVFFGLANYIANYEDRIEDNRVIIINQISHTIGKGFGIMAGAEINSFAGFSPIIGPQHNFASKKILAVTVASFFLNKENDFKIFGLYEFKPPINENWSFYSRLQFNYNRSLKEESHNKSYIYLRAGVKRKSLIFGLGTNVDWSGPNKNFQDNYGGFIRWELK